MALGNSKRAPPLDAHSRINLHIRPALDHLLVSKLTLDGLEEWQKALVRKPKQCRMGKTSKQRKIRASTWPTSKCMTDARILQTASSALKGALNFA
jgi:hypothetical protein